MPRRPRPSNRPPKIQTQPAPSNTTKHSSNAPTKINKQSRPKAVDFLSESEQGGDDEENDDDSDGNSDSEGKPDEGSEEEEYLSEYQDDDDADAPRVAQWVEDDFQLEGSDDESDEDDPSQDTPGPSRSQLRSLEDDLSTMPLGMLRKAQHALSQAQALDDSDSDSEPGSEGSAPREEISSHPLSKGKEKMNTGNPKKLRKEIAERANKHAPMEMTSKKPVTRRRTVINVQAPQPRDPRFVNLSGELSTHKFRQQYGFLSDLHSSELKTLRETLKRARKLLENSPRDQRAERQAEVQRLELAVKRAESTVNRDKREKVEAEALQSVAKEEREKRKQGKTGWWMKDSAKKELLTKARYDALAATGGKHAVKKAIEKKQKKIGQKEKKSRPFPRGGADQGSHKRPARFESSNEGAKQPKRRKIGLSP